MPYMAKMRLGDFVSHRFSQTFRRESAVQSALISERIMCSLRLLYFTWVRKLVGFTTLLFKIS